MWGEDIQRHPCRLESGEVLPYPPDYRNILHGDDEIHPVVDIEGVAELCQLPLEVYGRISIRPSDDDSARARRIEVGLDVGDGALVDAVDICVSRGGRKKEGDEEETEQKKGGQSGQGGRRDDVLHEIEPHSWLFDSPKAGSRVLPVHGTQPNLKSQHKFENMSRFNLTLLTSIVFSVVR